MWHPKETIWTNIAKRRRIGDCKGLVGVRTMPPEHDRQVLELASEGLSEPLKSYPERNDTHTHTHTRDRTDT